MNHFCVKEKAGEAWTISVTAITHGARVSTGTNPQIDSFSTEAHLARNKVCVCVSIFRPYLP